ncbi:hypothetical protein RRG08_031291 [Elysia crispata]|uniref:Uncharacterized protein n=1 Tax=Elysia crispata TaxID=231223 RepID=A0AAE1AJI7_9GAST|nr:hypothetical protein RRG08_031291 [Elysia crispata]
MSPDALSKVSVYRLGLESWWLLQETGRSRVGGVFVYRHWGAETFGKMRKSNEINDVVKESSAVHTILNLTVVQYSFWIIGVQLNSGLSSGPSARETRGPQGMHVSSRVSVIAGRWGTGQPQFWLTSGRRSSSGRTAASESTENSSKILCVLISLAHIVHNSHPDQRRFLVVNSKHSIISKPG